MDTVEQFRILGEEKKGWFDCDKIAKIIFDYIVEQPEETYEVVIGTDSQNHERTKISKVIAARRIGHGGKVFYKNEFGDRIDDLRQKIYEETQQSLSIANEVVEKVEMLFLENEIDIEQMNVSFQIHCDIGRYGKTQTLIKDITSWVQSLGFEVQIKPDSWAASAVADKLSK